jgi:hypothetical protein
MKIQTAIQTTRTTTRTTTTSNAPPARSSEFESVGAILERVIAARGEVFAHRLKKAREGG